MFELLGSNTRSNCPYDVPPQSNAWRIPCWNWLTLIFVYIVFWNRGLCHNYDFSSKNVQKKNIFDTLWRGVISVHRLQPLAECLTLKYAVQLFCSTRAFFWAFLEREVARCLSCPCVYILPRIRGHRISYVDGELVAVGGGNTELISALRCFLSLPHDVISFELGFLRSVDGSRFFGV